MPISERTNDHCMKDGCYNVFFGRGRAGGDQGGFLPYGWLEKPREVGEIRKGKGGRFVEITLAKCMAWLCEFCCYLEGDTLIE